MNFDKLDRWISVAANIGVLVGILFLVQEIRTNTESNILGVQEAYTGFFIQINSLMISEEMGELAYKTTIGEPLSPSEELRVDAWFRLLINQFNFIKRLYDQGVVTDIELRETVGTVRYVIQGNQGFQRRTESLSEDYRQLLLEEDGLEAYIQSSN